MRHMLVVIFCLFAGISQAETVGYTPGGAHQPALDIYAPDGAETAPVMVFIHGGGWMEGSRRKVFDNPAYFNSLGYVFVSVGYTLAPEATVEQQLAQIDQALGWVTQNIGSYGGDAGRVYLLGHSAGAHLVMMSVLRPLETMQGWLAQGRLRGVISDDVRAYDLPLLQSYFPDGRFTGPYEVVFGNQDPARLARLSPQRYLGSEALAGAAAPESLPPVLVAWSGAEKREDLSRSFANALRQSGVDTREVFADGYSHGEMNKLLSAPGPLRDAVEAFLAAAP